MFLGFSVHRLYEDQKKGKGKGKKKTRSEYDSEEYSADDTGAASAKKGGSGGAKNFPDKQGFLSLYIFRGDLVNGIRANENLCLWRRDGSSLLQKYLRDKNSSECQWSPSMVYSCWEDRRKDEYLEVKVLCKGDLKNSNVTIVDLDQLEEECVRDRESNSKFVSQKPQGANQSANDSNAGNTSQEGMEEEEGDDGEEE
uniref:CSON005310 protein n=1 Tax=Culicoides sonorensis TaxID=179676 RepID=A0A336LUX9_CULSO